MTPVYIMNIEQACFRPYDKGKPSAKPLAQGTRTTTIVRKRSKAWQVLQSGG
jgi:hypothetical protein